MSRASKAQRRSESELRNERDRSRGQFGSFFQTGPEPGGGITGGIVNKIHGEGYMGEPIEDPESGPGVLLRRMSESGISLLDFLKSAMSLEGPLPFGLNAPGVLDNLISRGRETIDSRTQQGARQFQDMFPAMGGAAMRGVSDIYRRGASESSRMETGLRAEAAQRSLSDRLAILGGGAGSFGAMNPMGAIMGSLGMNNAMTSALSQNQQAYSNMMMNQQNAQAAQQAGLYGALGSGLMQAGGAAAGAAMSQNSGTGY